MTHFEMRLTMTIAVLWAQVAAGQLTTFNIIDYPGSKGTLAYGINDAGQIVGHYRDDQMLWRGFLLRDGNFTTVDFPGARQTQPHKINAQGDIAGVYSDNANKQHGFVLSGGKFTSIDFPGADQTMVYAINSRGDLTGMYFAPGNPKHYGWALINGRFVTIDHPSPNDMSCGSWIGDDGQVAGHVQGKDGSYRGYVWKEGSFTLLEIQGGETWQFWDSIYEMNAGGDVLGAYSDARGKQRSFLMRKNGSTTFDVPGSQRTRATGMNGAGRVVGMFVDGSGVTHGFVTSATASTSAGILTVDDDGADCPGAFRTIQEAVAAARPGATILVCPGIYRNQIVIRGEARTGLKLIATGGENAVVLQGDYTERDGIHLMDVSNVLIRGFTVRDFGNKPTTATEWGAGNQIYLQNAHYNTIEHNRLINGDMMGIMLVDSHHNSVQQNVAFVDNPNLTNCGIHAQGAKTTRNIFRQNMLFGNKFAGIMIRGAGPGNIVVDNTVVSNGRFGIDVENTSDIWIEGNRASYNRGFWGISPGGTQPGVGIYLANVTNATVFDNRLRSNSGTDLSWDGRGDNKIEANACDTSLPAGQCNR